MFTHAGLCLTLVTIIFLNMVNEVSTRSADVKQHDKERSSAALLERFGVDPSYFLINHPYNGDDIVKDVVFNEKRQLKKKWARFFQDSQSPYTIAFPALIRTRRSIEQD